MIPQFIKQALKSNVALEQFLQRVRNDFYTRILYSFKSLGSDVVCNGGLKLSFADTAIGNNVFIGYGCYFGVENIKIGNFVLLAPNVAFTGGDHRFDLPGIVIIDTGLERWRKVQTKQKGITVEDDVWIGYGATIMDGITVGEGSIIGARSVVTKDIEPYSIYAGVPARKIGERFTEDERRMHTESIRKRNTSQP